MRGVVAAARPKDPFSSIRRQVTPDSAAYQVPSYFGPLSTTRIPHLELHLSSRSSANRPTDLPTRVPTTQRRCVGTSIPWPSSIESAQEPPEKVEDSPDAPIPVSGFHDDLDEILQEAHPERVFYALLFTAAGKNFIQQADRAEFSSAFRSIDPCFIIEPFKDAEIIYRPSLENNKPKYRFIRELGGRLGAFAEDINDIVSLRVRAGHRLNGDDYRHLLHSARVLGHRPLAEVAWQMMQWDETARENRDNFAYNCYMEAICKSNTFGEVERWRLRVTPRILQLRSSSSRPPDLAGHQVGVRGLRDEALAWFRQMVEENLDGDEETFANLMLAMGREADMNGVKSILKSAYNIDVDLLLQLDEEELESPTFYELDSPLRPTGRLLYTIAHVFSSNNQVDVAMKLVDFVSRNYDLQIPLTVWMHLLQWGFVLTKPRKAIEMEQGQALGQIDSSFIDTIWAQMTDLPHNAKPNLFMHLLLARSLQFRALMQPALDHVHAARSLLEQRYGEAERVGKQLFKLNEEILQDSALDPDGVLPAKWFDLRREFVLTSLREDADLQLLIVTARRLLEFQPFFYHDWVGLRHWERRWVPDQVLNFQQYLPNSIVYRTGSGWIYMVDLKRDRVATAKANMHMSRRTGLVRMYMDRHIVTLGDLRWSMTTLRKKLGEKYESQYRSRSIPSS